MMTVTRSQLLAAADACEQAATADDVQAERRACMAVIAHQHVIQVGLMKLKLQRLASLNTTGRREERLPLRQDGEDWGYVESRLPADVWWQLYKQKNFGWDGLRSDDGQKEIRKAYPVCAPKTITGRTTVPVTWRGSSRSRRVHFGRGTIQLAT